MLYEAFDKFLALDTWHTRHPSDQRRFYIALSSVIKDPQFNPDRLGEYIRKKKTVSRDNQEDLLNIAIDGWVTSAWAVKDYLEANGL